MPPEFTTYLPLILIALAVLAVAIWALLRTNRKARVIEDGSAPALGRDVLDEGAAPAARNQALIDAPRAAQSAPAPTPAPAPLPTSASGDDLTRIKGLGPKIAALLAELGVTRFDQIAAWSPQDIERIDAQLGRFAGRITRDQWVEQAELLAAGDETGFTSQYGNNG
jgi:predicted flap endonuclease-1-like 5' DNA nuclease